MRVEGRGDPPDFSLVLAELIASTRFEDFPKSTVTYAKYLLLDGVSVAMAGSNAPGIRELYSLVGEWGGAAQSRLFVYGDRVPSSHAAMVNAAMMQARDYDDTHYESAVHALCTVLPAALAEAERLGTVDGKSLLAALVLGVEVSCRIGAAIGTPLRFSRTAALGCLAAAAAASRVACLSPEQTHHALGLAYSQAAGNLQIIMDRGLGKRMQPGFAARSGVTAARLAAMDVTGSMATIEGSFGYLNLYERGARFADSLRDQLGERWMVEEIAVKPFPAALDSQGAIEAALGLRERGIRLEEVEKLDVFASQFVCEVGGTAFDQGHGHPIAEAILSIPYAVAAALVDGDVRLRHFTELSLARADLQEMARRVRVCQDPSIPKHAFVPVRLVARLESGGDVEQETRVLKGSPEDPLSKEEQLNKLRECVTLAAGNVDDRRIDRLVGIVDRIETVDNVALLADAMMLTGGT